MQAREEQVELTQAQEEGGGLEGGRGGVQRVEIMQGVVVGQDVGRNEGEVRGVGGEAFGFFGLGGREGGGATGVEETTVEEEDLAGGVPEEEGFGGDPAGGEGAAQGEDGVGEEEGLLEGHGGGVAVEGGDTVEGEGGREGREVRRK